MISGILCAIRCNGARLHHEQEGFRQSPGVDYTLTVICAEQVLPIIRENFGQLISQLSGIYVAPRALNAISESSRAAVRLSSPSLRDGVRRIKQTTNSKRIYFCCQQSGLRGTSESTKLTTTVSGLHTEMSATTKATWETPACRSGLVSTVGRGKETVSKRIASTRAA